MKLSAFFILLISNVWLSAMELPTIVQETIVLGTDPGNKMTWTARLSNGENVSASALYKSRKTRHSRPEYLLETHYIGHIGKRRVRGEIAQAWVMLLIHGQLRRRGQPILK